MRSSRTSSTARSSASRRRPRRPGWSASSRSPCSTRTPRRAGRHLAYVPLGFAVVTRRLWLSRTTSRYELGSAGRGGRQPGSRPGVGEAPGRVPQGPPRAARGHDQGARRGPAGGAEDRARAVHRVRRVRHAAGHRERRTSARWPSRSRWPPASPRSSPSCSLSRGGRSCWPCRGSPWARSGTSAAGHAGRAAGGSTARKADDEDAGWSSPPTRSSWPCRTCRYPALRKAFKDGWKPTFHTLPVRDGRGYAAVFSLPLGVTAEMIADQRPVLARNLHRAEIEVWPTDAEQAGRPGRDRACGSPTPACCPSPRRSTRCCTRAPPTCSRACPAACRPAATSIADPDRRQQLRRAAARWARARATPAA